MRIVLLILLMTNFASAQSTDKKDIPDDQIKLQAGSELIIQQSMQKNAASDMDLIFRCKNNAKTAKVKCFVIDKKFFKK